MVKSKKMSKTSIAIIVLALLLVLSLVMGMTGAWFSDKESANGSNISFGTLEIVDDSVAVARQTGETAVVMPGDTVHFTINFQLEGTDLAANGAWVRYKVTGTVNGDEDLALDAAASGYTFDDPAATPTAGDGWCYINAVLKSAEEQTLSVAATFAGASYDNDYQGATITYSVEIQIVQAKNLVAQSAKAAFAEVGTVEELHD